MALNPCWARAFAHSPSGLSRFALHRSHSCAERVLFRERGFSYYGGWSSSTGPSRRDPGQQDKEDRNMRKGGLRVFPMFLVAALIFVVATPLIAAKPKTFKDSED